MFRFKQFIVHDDRCALKVGTDGTLLGAWATPHKSFKGGKSSKVQMFKCSKLLKPLEPFKPFEPLNPSTSPHWGILDIGTGSGLIALMLAQRFPDAQIEAIDIDPSAAEQAAENFAASPWSDRLTARCISLQDYTQTLKTPETFKTSKTSPRRPLPQLGKGCPQGGKRAFSLIVSNPPYFVDSLKNPDAGKSTARHTDSLSYEELLRCSSELLAPDGTLALILPADAEDTIIRLAAVHDLVPCALTRVRTRSNKPFKRILIAFRFRPFEPSKTFETLKTFETSKTFNTSLSLMSDDGAPRSAEYIALTKDFYL